MLRMLAAGVCISLLTACATLETSGVAEPTAMEECATGVVFETVRVGEREHAYAVYVPRDYTPDKDWPVIVFLNGRGECGTDGQKQLAVGLCPAILANRDAWPFIVVFPQKPVPNSNWVDHKEMVLAALERTEATYSTDGDRVYLTGLSQGGRGTWEIAAAYPDRFAAIAPICGFGDATRIAEGVRHLPVWAFHGEKDDVVPPKATTDIIDALKTAGAAPKLTLYPDANHNSWDQAYRAEKLGAWFLEHRRGAGKP